MLIWDIVWSEEQFIGGGSPADMLHIHKKDGVNDADDPRVDGFIDTFEFYWNRYVQIGIAVFAASIFFNMVMCAFINGNKVEYYTQKGMFVDESDDSTEEESEDSDALEEEDNDESV